MAKARIVVQYAPVDTEYWRRLAAAFESIDADADAIGDLLDRSAARHRAAIGAPADESGADAAQGAAEETAVQAATDAQTDTQKEAAAEGGQRSEPPAETEPSPAPGEHGRALGPAPGEDSPPAESRYRVSCVKPHKRATDGLVTFEPLYEPIDVPDAAGVIDAIIALRAEWSHYRLPVENHTDLPL
jgi:hypothetical protein